MNDAILEAIKKSLPGLQAEELQKLLLEGHEAKKQAASYKERYEAAGKSIASLNEQILADKKAVADAAHVLKRELDVDFRERAEKVKSLEAQLAAEKRVSIAFEGALAGLVRNTEWREQTAKAESRGHVLPAQNGCGAYVTTHTDQTSHNISKEAK